ncbi:trypsin-like serine peptidase [Tropicimonas marinistellae]|uniref:trypsin-like serine peptidase n=1 Tax=Tropicimonas marinistellae TaxID=1739787 RepID=UPI00082BA695|nr:trypsin-like peptidase domain-containing protein [Tropicimonas marinistellae]
MSRCRPHIAVSRAVLALIFGLMAGGPATATDSGLKRLTLRHDSLGWEAVGRLDLSGRGFCTGVLIETDLVLTAAHCLIDRRSGARVDPRALRFRAGLRDGEAIAERSGIRAVLHPNYAPNDSDGIRQLVSDVALVVLDAPIPAATAAPFTVGTRVAPGGTVSLVSYARGRDQALSWQRACSVLGRGQGALLFTCDADFGSSGAPVFEISSGRGRIVSLVSRGLREDGKSNVYGPEIAAPLAATRRALREGRGVWPEAGFAARRLPAPGFRGLSDDRDTGAHFVKP